MENYYEGLDGFSNMGEQGLLFKDLLKNLKIGDKLKIAEIGVYKGRMTAMICEILCNMGIKTEYYCIDHFKGSPEHENKDYYPEFCDNMSRVSFNGINIIPIVLDSISATKLFDNKSLDIVYVDASHNYESVKNDIAEWLPKIKSGGILCGDDYISGWDGVIKAVDEAFGKDNIKKIGSQQWLMQL